MKLLEQYPVIHARALSQDSWALPARTSRKWTLSTGNAGNRVPTKIQVESLGHCFLAGVGVSGRIPEGFMG